jgi:dipeptidase D
MMMEHNISDSVTAGVLKYFKRIADIPHDSGHEEALASEMASWLEDKGGKSVIDSTGNMISFIPASKGCENAPLLMLQGHIDMVCAAKEESGWDSLNDKVTLCMKKEESTGREILCSDGNSSLGADCGMGDAGIFWAMENVKKHGPVKILMTVKEEIGLVGANKLETSVLDDVKYLINVDGFSGGTFVGGSAGGRREDYVRRIYMAGNDSEECIGIRLRLHRFRGGHSGYDIDRGRANPVCLMARFLYALRDDGMDFEIASFTGGLKHNVIPSECESVILLRPDDADILEKHILQLKQHIRENYYLTDPEGVFDAEKTENVPERVMMRDDRDAFIDFLMSVYSGVYRYMEALPDLPDTSCNLGKAVCNDESIHVMLFERSSSRKWHDELMKRHSEAAQRCGFELTDLEEYMPWVFNGDNPLMQAAAEEYESITGEKANLSAVHVGLEPSVFAAKREGMYMINMGADVLDPHTVHERVYVDSIRPFALTLAALIERIAELIL